MQASNKGPLTGRGGRVAEGGGLLNRYTVQSRIKGSNPFLSAILRPFGVRVAGHLNPEGRRVSLEAPAQAARPSAKNRQRFQL